MARSLHKLTNAEIKSAPPGKLGDGGGLWLYRREKRDDHGAKWVLRYTIHGRRHEMGLGRYPDVSLNEARDEAEKWRAVVRQGRDAIKERERRQRISERNAHILRDIALDAFESRKAELKDDGRAGRWFSPLELHVLPKLGRMPVSEIDQRDIRDALQPIWHTKAATAKKALNRLGICLRHAAALGLEVDIQATDKALALLGRQRHVPKHIPAMPWQDVPEFYRSLSDDSTTELALRLLILTAVRSFPLRNIHEDQIDGDLWTIPGDAMKARVGDAADFRVPLSTEAQSVIQHARKFAREGLLFPGIRKGVISDMTMTKFMDRRGLDARPHGFRSSFRDWAAEATNTPRDVAETALGHSTGGAVERAYRRTDFLEQRRALMERWANCLLQQSEVIAIDATNR